MSRLDSPSDRGSAVAERPAHQNVGGVSPVPYAARPDVTTGAPHGGPSVPGMAVARVTCPNCGNTIITRRSKSEMKGKPVGTDGVPEIKEPCGPACADALKNGTSTNPYKNI